MSGRPARALPLARLLEHVADAVAAVRAGRSLTDALDATPPPARPGTQALSFAAMRGLGRALALRERLAPKAPPAWVDALLLAALALAHEAEQRGDAAPYPLHTLVDQAVEAARTRAPAQARFVNAVLRRAAREAAELDAAVRADPVARLNHPRWWVERLRADWPEQADALLAANQQAAPMVLRVNARRSTLAEELRRFAEAGIGARAWPLGEPGARASTDAIVLDAPRPVAALPGFAEGRWSVQDLAAQRAAPLLLGAAALLPGARVLDACAAPGGKTAQLLELAELDLLALDVDARRLERVGANLARLGLSARLVAGDATAPAAWWDGRPFDAILLDAPCTGSGVVRRHPDIRWLRRPGDVAALAATQARLLDALWPLLAQGGHLLYATCSVFRAEGAAQIEAFLQRESQAEPKPSPGHLLPLAENAADDAPASDTVAGDGFFYALLRKRG
ncbi:MAG TPA: 16S rRNA (cytosine(967)-C(5))-methyltransferase RsmB [Methylibium sp.]|uniref:16S rRNA (cytosine(967)-C(5))-methyltransferase RsmB n=1 Tax=Methylibium sp. TaxID=2067992 RepID=UPI002DB8E308|nr:16S rRNA (cytosine(967)-C(5))-methyltransferase RsmB [Methylibium sp.]HEU4458711.1 16S rRNA (cytosine(967)-C(5))-methyltransferase RsmB [Methylibium sp.]